MKLFHVNTMKHTVFQKAWLLLRLVTNGDMLINWVMKLFHVNTMMHTIFQKAWLLSN